MLAKKLQEIREEEGMSYQQFADHLRLSKTHVHACLTNGTPMGRKFIEAVLDKYPELGGVVLSYIRNGANKEKNEAASKVYRTRKRGPAEKNKAGPGTKTKRLKNQGITYQSRL